MGIGRKDEMKQFFAGLATDMARAAIVAAVGVIVKELILMLEPRRGGRPYEGGWFEDD